MLAFLLCLISVACCTFLYVFNKIFGEMEGRSSLSRRRRRGDNSPAISDSELDDQADIDDDVLVGGDASKMPVTTKRRSKSVIDSIGASDSILLPGHSTPRRTKSQPAQETSPDQGYSATPEPKPGRSKRRLDAVDALPHVAARNDDEDSDSSPKTITVSVPTHKDAVCYNMKHKRRGKCVIFNHEVFDPGFEKRDGSTTDALRIQKTFKALGFTVDVFDDLPYNEVTDQITKLSEEDHRDDDCICIFVLTHGLSNDLIAARDVAYKLDKIWKPFTANRCLTLAGKPKLFFFQACRGNELDGGVAVRRSSEMTETDSSVASYKIPTHADFLIAHSTVQGFFSWRDPEEGTWYIQCLCEVLDQYWRTTDLLSMLTITARKVATEYASYNDINPAKHEQKQVPSVTSMLIRDIYFTPKEQ